MKQHRIEIFIQVYMKPGSNTMINRYASEISTLKPVSMDYTKELFLYNLR